MGDKNQSMEQKIDMILKTVTETKTEIVNIKTDLEVIKEENIVLKNKITDLEKKINNIEKKEKSNDLIFYGMSEERYDTYEKLEEKIIHVINNTIRVKITPSDVVICHRIGITDAKKNNKRTRPVLIKFINTKIKFKILKNAVNLKDSGYAVTENFTEKIMKERQLLKPFLAKAKDSGKKAYLKQNKLCVNNQEFTYEELKNEGGNCFQIDVDEDDPDHADLDNEGRNEQTAASRQNTTQTNKRPRRNATANRP